METTSKELSKDMLPFIMKELVDMVMQKKALLLNDALHYIYSSHLYESLLNEDAKLWYSSTLLLYEALEKEKAEKRKRQNRDMKILLFKMFCIEKYRFSKEMSAEEALLLFSKYKVFDFLENTFEMLHTQDTEYIIDTINTYIKNKR